MENRELISIQGETIQQGIPTPENPKPIVNTINKIYSHSDNKTSGIHMWWECPRCGQKVDFTKQMSELFNKYGEAYFDPNGGVWLHTIECECGCEWVMTLSGIMESHEVEDVKG